MGEEKKFEKKSAKKIGIIIGIIIIVAALVVGGILYFNNKKKPEKIFADTVKDVFEMTEGKQEELKSGRVELELTADVDSSMVAIKTISPMIKAIKLNSITEFDLDKKILNQNLLATYNGEQVVSVDTLLQDERVYVYLKDLYSKYIDFTDELTSELGTEFDFTTIFEGMPEPVDKKLLEDIEKILVDEINSKEISQEKTELNGKNVTKSILKLSSKETCELLVKLLKKIEEYNVIEGIAELRADLESEIEYMEETAGDYLEISLYTKGLNNSIVNCTAIVVADGQETMKLEYNEESDKKSTITLEFEGALIGAIIENEEKNKTTVKLVCNFLEAKLSNATEIAEILVKEENDNEGNIELIVHIGEILSANSINAETVKTDIILNIKYKVENNAKIEKRDVSNSISSSEMTDEDYIELYENIEKNYMLYSIFNSL